MPTASAFTLFMQHWGIREEKRVSLMKSIGAEKIPLWLKTVDSVCTKMRKILGQAVFRFGYSDLEEKLSGAPASGVRDGTCVLSPPSWISLPPALFPPWHPRQRSAILAELARSS